jgi:hypothetical protein
MDGMDPFIKGDNMKRKLCMCCFNPAAYESKNSNLRLCEECYLSFSDDYESSMEEEYGMPFDEYYDIEEIEYDD